MVEELRLLLTFGNPFKLLAPLALTLELQTNRSLLSPHNTPD